eukprot:3242212-Amphidinium_carterae.1
MFAGLGVYGIDLVMNRGGMHKWTWNLLRAVGFQVLVRASTSDSLIVILLQLITARCEQASTQELVAHSSSKPTVAMKMVAIQYHFVLDLLS